MDPVSHRYVPTPDDPARVDRVHRLITENPKEFAATGARLDKFYTAKACLKRDLKSLPFKRKHGAAQFKAWTERADAALERWKALKGKKGVKAAAEDEHRLRATALGYRIPTLQDWKRRATRFRRAVHDLLETELQVSVPNPSWDWAANVLLLFWIVCDQRAEHAEISTDFQRWRWSPTKHEPAGREIAQWMVPDAEWSELNRAVDLAIEVAKQHLPDHGSEPGHMMGAPSAGRTKASSQLPQLNKKELAAHKLLLRQDPLAPMSSGRISTQLAREGVSFADDVFRKQTAPRLRAIGLKSGSRGYWYPAECVARRLAAEGGAQNPQVVH